MSKQKKSNQQQHESENHPPSELWGIFGFVDKVQKDVHSNKTVSFWSLIEAYETEEEAEGVMKQALLEKKRGSKTFSKLIKIKFKSIEKGNEKNT